MHVLRIRRSAVVSLSLLTLWLLLVGCGGGGSGSDQQSSSEDTQQTESQSSVEATVGETDGGEDRFSSETIQQLDGAIAQVMSEENLPGVAVAVSVPGEGEYVQAQGAANLETGRGRQPNDPFRIGSITKTFTATALLQLVDQGQLSKSDPLSNWYPDFPNAEQITVDDLLSMRSGIPDYWDDETLRQYYDNPLEDVSAEDIIQQVAGEADRFETPNQQTQYNNTNYSILQRIVEEVSGNDLGTQITENIIRPLGMTNTVYPVDSELPGELRGYGLNPESEQFEDKTVLSPAPPGGAGAIISDISDLGVYARALYNGDLLTPQAHQERLEVQQLEGAPETAGYGEGIAKLGNFWGHNGEIQGFSSEMWLLPQLDATIVISVNRGDADYESTSTDVLGVVAQTLFPEYVESDNQTPSEDPVG
jgi:D-alanyl-D-alanine carboxypeptidase